MHAPIRMSDVRVSRGGTSVLRGVSAEFPAGAVTLLTGANGSGKSTLIGVLAGTLPVDRGLVEPRARSVALVGQGVRASARVPLTVRETVAMGRWGARRWWRPLDREDHRLVEHAMERLDLTDLRSRPLEVLSGGQLQRVLIARALAQRADALLLDEAATALDAASGLRLEEIAREQAADGQVVVMVSHDDRAQRIADRVLRLRDGAIEAADARV